MAVDARAVVGLLPRGSLEPYKPTNMDARYSDQRN